LDQYCKSIESLSKLGEYLADSQCPEKLLPLNGGSAKMNNLPDGKGKDLGFRETITGSDMKTFEYPLHPNNNNFHYISINLGFIFDKIADINALKEALK
jgi:hypothetical protein